MFEGAATIVNVR